MDARSPAAASPRPPPASDSAARALVSTRPADHDSAADRDSPADLVAGFMATAAIFVGAIALVVRPVPLSIAALVLSLVATAMAGPRFSRLAAVSVGAASLAFVLSMTIAVLARRSLF